ncbi:MAG: hypothetical protein M3P33_01830, partial [bacterium]|nr:hypothetical protein [bacterium]
HTVKVVVNSDGSTYEDNVRFFVKNNNLTTNSYGQIVGLCPDQVVKGNLYVVYDTQGNSIDKVDFSISGSTYRKTESVAPYALNGDDLTNKLLIPFDSLRLPDGPYTLVAKVTDDGRENQLSLPFRINNRIDSGTDGPIVVVPTPTPTPTPVPTPTPRPSISPIRSPTSLVTPPPQIIPPPTIPPNNGISLIQVDPTSGTDNHVNKFLKDLVAGGVRKVAMGGAWWGPTDRFFENQLWVVNKNISIGRIYREGESISTSFTCLQPGKINPVGTSRNFLTGFDGRSSTPPRLRFQQTSDNPIIFKYNNPLTQFLTISQGAFKSSGGFELRTSCAALEGKANQFGDGSPLVGKDVHPGLGQSMWYGSRGSATSTSANHDGLALKYESLDNHGWYDNEGYVFSVLDGAEMVNNGNLTHLSNEALVGGVVRGDLTVFGFGSKGSTALTKSLLGQVVDSDKMPIHHIELKIEQGNEDYTVGKYIESPSTLSGLTNYQRRRTGFKLNTRILSEGWHVLSWHVHAIDHHNPVPFRGKQLASEIKIPICVDNDNNGSCN